MTPRTRATRSCADSCSGSEPANCEGSRMRSVVACRSHAGVAASRRTRGLGSPLAANSRWVDRFGYLAQRSSAGSAENFMSRAYFWVSTVLAIYSWAIAAMWFLAPAVPIWGWGLSGGSEVVSMGRRERCRVRVWHCGGGDAHDGRHRGRRRDSSRRRGVRIPQTDIAGDGSRTSHRRQLNSRPSPWRRSLSVLTDRGSSPVSRSSISAATAPTSFSSITFCVVVGLSSV